MNNKNICSSSYQKLLQNYSQNRHSPKILTETLGHGVTLCESRLNTRFTVLSLTEYLFARY